VSCQRGGRATGGANGATSGTDLKVPALRRTTRLALFDQNPRRGVLLTQFRRIWKSCHHVEGIGSAV